MEHNSVLWVFFKEAAKPHRKYRQGDSVWPQQPHRSKRENRIAID
jgi:hypothetical protein